MSGARKKLCLVLPGHFSVGAGGAEMQVKMLLEKLIEHDRFDIHYIARHQDATHVPVGYQLHRLAPARQLAGTFLKDGPALARALADIAPDVIYQRVACAWTGFSARFAARSGARLVWHVSSDRDLLPTPWRLDWRTPFEQLNKRLIDRGARAAHAIVVQNREQQRLLERRHGRRDAFLIGNFHPAPGQIPMRRPDRLTVCWIANIKEIKRPDIFLKLAADLAHLPHLEFVIAGKRQMTDGPWREFVRRLAGVPNVSYLGGLSNGDVETLLERTHLLVNTSPHEGFPNTFIQAWLREVPVVSLTVNPDGLLDGERMGICARGQYPVLKSAVETLARETGRRERLGNEARRHAREHFSMNNAQRLIELLWKMGER